MARKQNKNVADLLRNRFETRLDDVRDRFETFQKDWSKTVDRLVARGRTAEKDLRKRLDKVTRDLNKTPIVKTLRTGNALQSLRKNPTIKRVTSDVLGAVRGVNYEKAVKDLRREVNGFQKEVGAFFQASATRVKQVVDLPTRSDFERLNKKIETLTSQVRGLERRKRA